MTGRRRGRIIDAAKLRELIGRRLWSLNELSEAADVSYRTVKYAVSEHQRVYTPAICYAIAGALNTPEYPVQVDDFSTFVGPGTTVEDRIRSVLPDARIEMAG